MSAEEGIHEEGIGFAPDGTWCGECCDNTCVGCSVWNDIKLRKQAESDNLAVKHETGSI